MTKANKLRKIRMFIYDWLIVPQFIICTSIIVIHYIIKALKIII